MKTRSPVNNCYRAILALLNQLDSIYQEKTYIKELYEDLTELAFYLMEDDCDRVARIVNEIKESLGEIECIVSDTRQERNEELGFFTAELKTHLDYLLIEYCKPKLKQNLC
jgi:archaellum component FlaC